jgi:hypothetical protein
LSSSSAFIHEPEPHGVVGNHEDDRDRFRRGGRRLWRLGASGCENQVQVETDQLSGGHGEPFSIRADVALLHREIPAFAPSDLAQPFSKHDVVLVRPSRIGRRQNPDTINPAGLLRAARDGLAEERQGQPTPEGGTPGNAPEK